MKKMLKKLVSLALCICLCAAAAPQIVKADAYKPYLSLGADLTPDQRKTVLSLLKVEESEFPNLSVSYVTNAEEHQYLDAYMSSSDIGKHALSSVLIKETDPGMGLSITTKNISVCTEGMYRNACATAGITDAEIIVAGPFPISGTAALVGIFKAYKDMSGQAISEDVIDGALNELVVTGDLEGALSDVDSDVIEGMISEVKQRMAKDGLKDEASISKAVDEVSAEYGVQLSSSERQTIIDLLQKLSDLNIDPSILSGAVDTVAGALGIGGNSTNKDASSTGDSGTSNGSDGNSGGGFFASIGNFFSNIAKAISNFFSNLFGKK